ncbi:MAG: MmcQ/YjbR family DNA-binding protein [Flavobacteriales bacterium]|nr:MmcQ/YjbR family DNA-binding protein [Flavobacteriales bacterium]
MNIEEYREYCLSKPGTTEHMPFDDNVLVFKVGNKMFALTGLNDFEYINLKCEPDIALELRAQYPSVRPGYHMSKVHWNSVYLHDGLQDGFVYELIDKSYYLILSSLPKKVQYEIRAEMD